MISFIRRNTEVVVFITLATIISFLVYYTSTSTEAIKPKPTKPIIEQPQQPPERSFIQVLENDLIVDIMNNYDELPKRTKTEIVNTIMESSTEYGINPLIIYFTLHAESSMRPHIKHSTVEIKVDNKLIKTQAIGLGGVIYEWWGEKLIKAGIIANKADLFDPILNIRATCFILNENYKMPMHPSATSKDGSALLRYFGGNSPSYFKRIDEKILSFVSNKIYR